jgi:probable rRNA maturation factor
MIEMMDETYNVNQSFYLEELEKIAEDLDIKGTIVIKLGDTGESRALNLKYLGKDYPTDVLSFPFNEELPDGFYVGDIFICYPIAAAQAGENNISLEEELFTLMVHGILHLCEYDHETDAGQMSAKQEQLVEKYFRPKKDRS